MTQPSDPNDNSASNEPTANGASAPAAEAPSTHAPQAPVAAAPTTTQDSADGDDGGDGGEEGGDDEGGGDEAHESAPHEGANVEGAPAGKRKRRRRRKKKPGAEGVTAEGTPGAEGTTPGAEGGATAEGAAGGARPDGNQANARGDRGDRGGRGPKPKRDRVERERPAFNVGDVVFGKVLEVTDDALFVDLSGKAKAIFDLRELTLTDEDVEAYTKADQREAEEIAAARAASAKGAAAAKTTGTESAATGEETADTAGSTEEAADDTTAETAATAEAPAETVDEARTSVVETAAASTTETTETTVSATEITAATEETAEKTAEATEGEPAEATEGTEGATGTDGGPQLPRVILEPGAPFVGLVHNDGGRGGLVVLTHHPKRAQKVKPVVGEASRSGALVFGLVTGTIKGGVEVDVDGLRAFAPASHVELRPGTDLSYLVGQRLSFAVTQYAKRGRDVVLSRRSMLESEAKEKREKALGTLSIGAVVDGIVKTVVPFGAFIDVGGVEGLVPLSEMSHNRADQPKDVFKVNETVKVKILRVDEKGKLWLSRRSAVEDPWTSVAAKYAMNTKHTGKVARLQPFGAFIELEPGIDGLIHTADLSVKRIEHPEEVIKVGDELEVVVAHVDPRAHRISLHPAPTGEAANEEPQKVQLSKMVKVVVVAAETGGLVVRIRGATGRNARGFISGAATGTPRGTELRKLYPVGKELDAKIIEMDPRRGELKLSIKALNEENERNAYQQYRAQVKREAKFGTFADLLAKRNTTEK